jgi:hypothetical protein
VHDAILILGEEFSIELEIERLARPAERAGSFHENEAIHHVLEFFEPDPQKVQLIEEEETVENHDSLLSRPFSAYQGP